MTLIILAGFIFVILFTLFYRKFGERADKIQTLEIFFLVLVAYLYLPSIVLLLDPEWRNFYVFYFDSELILATTQLSIASIFFGYYFLTRLEPRYSKNHRLLSIENIYISNIDKPLFILFIYINIFLMTFIVAHQLNEIITLLQNPSLIDEYRINYRQGGWVGPVSVILKYTVLLAIPVSYALRQKIQSRSYRYLYWLLILSIIAFYLTQFFRGLFVFLILTMFMSVIVFKKNVNYKKSFLFFAVFFLAIIVSITIFRVSDQGEGVDVFFLIAKRMVTPSAQLGYVLDNYDSLGTLFGESYLNTIRSLGSGADKGLSAKFFDGMGYAHDGGTATATFLADYYINFGYLGIFLCSFFTGIIIRMIERIRLLKPKASSQVTYIFLTMIASRFVLTGLESALIPLIVLFMIACVYVTVKFIIKP